METIEQEARKFAEENEIIKIKDAFRAGVEFAQRWIDVKEGLPKLPPIGYPYKVLVMDIRNNNIDVYMISNQNDINILGSLTFEFTHWRPIELKQ